MRRRAGCLVALGLACACSGEDDDRPPAIESRPPPHPLGCAEIQSGTVRADGAIVVSGVEAACAADGLSCPLASSTACDAGRTFARCILGSWTADCGADQP